MELLSGRKDLVSRAIYHGPAKTNQVAKLHNVELLLSALAEASIPATCAAPDVEVRRKGREGMGVGGVRKRAIVDGQLVGTLELVGSIFQHYKEEYVLVVLERKAAALEPLLVAFQAQARAALLRRRLPDLSKKEVAPPALRFGESGMRSGRAQVTLPLPGGFGGGGDGATFLVPDQPHSMPSPTLPLSPEPVTFLAPPPIPAKEEGEVTAVITIQVSFLPLLTEAWFQRSPFEVCLAWGPGPPQTRGSASGSPKRSRHHSASMTMPVSRKPVSQ